MSEPIQRLSRDLREEIAMWKHERDVVRAERDALREALERIANAPIETDEDGVVQMTDYHGIARSALSSSKESDG